MTQDKALPGEATLASNRTAHKVAKAGCEFRREMLRIERSTLTPNNAAFAAVRALGVLSVALDEYEEAESEATKEATV